MDRRLIIAALTAAAFSFGPAALAQQKPEGEGQKEEQAEPAETPEQAAKREREAREAARRAAVAKAAADAKRAKEEKIARCVIKPVMSDAEIQYCREVSYLK